MNKPPQDAWFYTREGERIGPVTLADLRVKALEATLNPRLGMVWTQGMARWKPAGEIEALFEQCTVITILVLVAVVALLFGAIGSPEIQEQLRQALRAIRNPATQP